MSVELLISQIRGIMVSEVAAHAEEIREFKGLKSKGNQEWFSELCFCILTANSSARLGIQKAIGAEGFLKLSEEEMAKRFSGGKPFSEVKADLIVTVGAEVVETRTIGSSNTQFTM